MKVLLPVLFLVSLAIESRCGILTYEWNKKGYYCGKFLTDIMEQACVRSPSESNLLTQVPDINAGIQFLQSKSIIEMTNTCENGHEMFIKWSRWRCQRRDCRKEKVPQMRGKKTIAIATRCCPEERIDPEINGCSINEILEDYCDHPERADKSKLLKIIENGGISSATITLKNMETTTTTPRVTSTATNSNTFSKTKRLNCKHGYVLWPVRLNGILVTLSRPCPL